MLGKERHKVSSVNKYLTSVKTSGKRNRWATRAKLVATTSTFPQLNHSIGIHGIGRGVGVGVGGGGAIKRGKSVVSLSRLLRKSTSGSWRTTNQHSGP